MSSGTTRSLTADIHVGAAGATGCKQPAHVVGGIPRGYAWFGVTDTTCMYCDSQGVSIQWRIYSFAFPCLFHLIRTPVAWTLLG